MSHLSRIGHPNPLAYQLLAPETKKKPEPKMARAGGWFGIDETDLTNSQRITEKREPGGDDPEEGESGAGRGFDATA